MTIHEISYWETKLKARYSDFVRIFQPLANKTFFSIGETLNLFFSAFFSVFWVLIPWGFSSTASAASALHIAAKQGNVKQVKRLLARKADVNSISSSGYTPLHISAGWDMRRVTWLLVSHGAKINARDSSGRTPLHLSASRGHLKMVKFLLSRGANSSIRDRHNRTPVDMARQYSFNDENDEIVDLLESAPKNKRAKKGSFFKSIHQSGIAYVILGTVGILWLVLEFVPNISF